MASNDNSTAAEEKVRMLNPTVEGLLKKRHGNQDSREAG
jgi:hypothetical protein